MTIHTDSTTSLSELKDVDPYALLIDEETGEFTEKAEKVSSSLIRSSNPVYSYSVLFCIDSPRDL
jgi:hypothetical protein